MHVDRAPRQRVRWQSQGIGSRFAYYLGFSRVGHGSFVPRFVIGVPPGYDRSTVEEQHTFFYDSMSGWHSDAYPFPPDWRILLVDITGAVSPIDTTLDFSGSANIDTLEDPGVPWLTVNAAPYLDTPLEIYAPTGSSLDQGTIVDRAHGRDRFMTATPSDKPGRQLSGEADFFGEQGPFELRYVRAIAESGRAAALLRPHGDRLVGTFDVGEFVDIPDHRQGVAFTMSETADEPCEHNAPAGLVFNGTNQCLTIAGGSRFNNITGAFCFAYCGGLENADAYAVALGDHPTDKGWALRCDGSLNIILEMAGADGTVTVTYHDADQRFFDQHDHVFLAHGTPGADIGEPVTVSLYGDGDLLGTATGIIGFPDTDLDVTICANDGGADGHMALGVAPPAWTIAPNAFHAFAYFGDLVVDIPELAVKVWHYLSGHANSRMPVEALSLLVDLRDDRCWDGIGAPVDIGPFGDRGGYFEVTVTRVGSPKTRGIPWALEELENV